MSLLFGTEVVLFPAMEGTLTLNGKPAADAAITVHVFWKDDVGEEETFYTDKEGNFSIPAKERRVRIPPLAEFVITQQMRVAIEGNEYVIWSKAAMGTDPHGGLGGEIEHIRCELTNKRKRIEIADGLFSTSCELRIAK